MATEVLGRTTDVPLVEPVVEKFQYPGIPTTCDGAEAVVWVETRISQGCGALPITSSTTMGGGFNQAVVNGVPNVVLRRLRSGGRASHELHLGARPRVDEGGAVHDRGQAAAGSV